MKCGHLGKEITLQFHISNNLLVKNAVMSMTRTHAHTKSERVTNWSCDFSVGCRLGFMMSPCEQADEETSFNMHCDRVGTHGGDTGVGDFCG